MSRTRLLGGLMSGLGQGMVSEHEQRRREALERAKMAQQRELAEGGWEHQASMQANQQEFQGEQNRLGREHTSTENEANRQNQRGLLQTKISAEDKREKQRGLMAANQAEIDDMDREQAREHAIEDYRRKREIDREFGTVEGGGRLPADAQLTDYLVQHGIANDRKQAWEMVRASRQDPNARTKMVTSLATSIMRNAPIGTQITSEQALSQAQQMIRELEQQEHKQGSSQNAPASKTNPWDREGWEWQ